MHNSNYTLLFFFFDQVLVFSTAAVNPKARLTAEYVMRSRAPARSRKARRRQLDPVAFSSHPSIPLSSEHIYEAPFSRILKPISSQWPLSRIVPSTPLPSSTRRFVPVLVSVLCAFAGEAPAAAFPHHPVCCSP